MNENESTELEDSDAFLILCGIPAELIPQYREILRELEIKELERIYSL